MRVSRTLRLTPAAVAAVLAVAVAIGARAAASDSASAAGFAVHVQRHLSVDHGVRVGFSASPLPHGGYYYAVLVLDRYRRYTRTSPPPCATSSNMQRTAYAYPRIAEEISLTLTPAHSKAGRWCRGGTYSGAVYAVPHPPPCESPCESEPYVPPSPCWNVGGHLVCGVVVRRGVWHYPDGLPTPRAYGTSVLARFRVTFPR